MRWEGATDVARRDKTEEACERRTCPSLSRLFAAGPASSLLVVGCRRCPSCDTHQVPQYSYLILDNTIRFSPFVFSWFSQSNIILQDCLLLLAAAVFILFRYFSRFFLRQSDGCASSVVLLLIMYSCMHRFINRVGTIYYTLVGTKISKVQPQPRQ